MIVCDGFTGNVVLKLSEGLVEMVEEQLGEELSSTFSSQVGYLLSRRAYRRFRKRVDYSEYGGAPLLGVAGLVLVCHGRSSAKAIRNAVVAASRFVDRSACWRGVEQARRRRHGVAAMIAFVFPGQGVAVGRHGPGAWPTPSRCAGRPSRRPTPRSASPLSEIIFDGPADRLTPHREHPAGDPDDERRRLPSPRAARAARPTSSPGTAWASIRPTSPPARFAFADAVRTVRHRGRYMQEAVPVGVGAMAAVLGLDDEAVRAACDEAAEGEVVSAGESQRAGPGRDRRARGRGRARRRAGQGARRQARDSAPGQRAVPLRADAAGARSGWRPSCAP